MQKLTEALGNLFSLSRDAVLGMQEGRVVFYNPAAELFGPALMGQEGTALLPAYVFEPKGTAYACTVTLKEEEHTVSVARWEGLLLLTIPRPEAVPVSPSILSVLRTTGYNLRLASECILSGTEPAPDEKTKTYLFLLHHNYYSLLRLTNDLADAGAIASGTLPFHPQVGDLAALCRELAQSTNEFTQAKLPDPLPGLRGAGVGLHG